MSNHAASLKSLCSCNNKKDNRFDFKARRPDVMRKEIENWLAKAEKDFAASIYLLNIKLLLSVGLDIRFSEAGRERKDASFSC